MSTSITVKVSKRYQIAVPRVARSQLNIQRGDRLLVDVQDGMLILLPQPQSYTSQMEGLHREVWEGIDTGEYLHGERAAWDDSQND